MSNAFHGPLLDLVTSFPWQGVCIDIFPDMEPLALLAAADGAAMRILALRSCRPVFGIWRGFG